MADQKLTQLTAITTVTDDDLLYLVDDPAGTPLSRKITYLDFKTAVETDLLAGTDNRVTRFDTTTGVQDSDWEILDTKELLPITAGNDIGSATKYAGTGHITNIEFKSSVSTAVITDTDSTAAINFLNTDNEIVISSKNATFDEAYLELLGGASPYFEAGIAGTYISMDKADKSLRLYRYGTSELFIGDNTGIGGYTVSDFDKLPVAISSRKAISNQNITNAVALGGVNLTMDKDDYAFTQNLEVQGGDFAHTSASGKFGVFGATPVVQPIHIADASGGATVDAEARTAINALLAQFATLGLQAAA